MSMLATFFFDYLFKLCIMYYNLVIRSLYTAIYNAEKMHKKRGASYK